MASASEIKMASASEIKMASASETKMASASGLATGAQRAKVICVTTWALVTARAHL